MSNITITNLPVLTSLSGSSQTMVVQNGVSYSATAQQIANLNANGGTLTSVTAQSPLSGGTITTTGTIGVTDSSITNQYLATMPANTIKGNNTSGVAAVNDLTVAQTMTLLGAAPLNSPTFTGTPTAPTPSSGDNSNTLATTAFVQAQSYGTGTVTSVTAGNGLSGGTITTTGTISLPTTGVSVGTYGSTTAVPVIAVDTYGRITSASNTTITPSNIGAASASTTISAGTGLSGGGDLSDNRTLALASVSAYAILSNISNVSAVPTGNSLSSILDAVIGTGQGSLIFRNDTQWTALSPGSAGQVLQTQGSSANPTWYSIPSTSGGGTVTSLTAGTNMSFSSNPITVTGTISTVNNPVFSTSVTSPLHIGGTTASSTLTLESTSGAGTTDSIIFKTGSQVTAMTIGTAQNINIGTGAVSAAATLRINKNITGATTLYSILGQGTIQSDVTTNFYGNLSQVSTQAASFTLGNLQHFAATQATIGIGSQITNQYGYQALGTIIGATNNYGFWGNIPSVTTATISNVALTSNVVTITTAAAHGYGTGQSVIIAATTTTSVNGTFTITSVPSTTTFTYALVAADIASVADTGSTYVNTGRYNFYAASNAPNQFGGSLTLNTVPNNGGSTLSVINPISLRTTALTYTDIVSATGTQALAPQVIFGAPTIAARNTGVVYTTAATVYINAAPTAGTNVTLTNSYALYVASGATQLQALNYTTSVGTTSGTVPLVIGGTAASSTLTLESTSGAGTTDSIIFKTGSQSERMRIDTSGNVSIGSSGTTTGINLITNAQITGAVASYAHYNNGSIQSGVTTRASAYVSNISTAAASFTVTDVPHFWAVPGAGGAGSTITNQYGFLVDAGVGTAGAATITNAYGFYGAIASAANRYNLYMAGTANNYMAGYTAMKQSLSTVAVVSIGTGTTATLTGAQILSGYITGAPTTSGTYTLPLASAVDTELVNAATNWAWEFTIATTSAFSITLATATGWTLVGSMATGVTANSIARFRAVKTGSAAYTLYRIS